MEQVQSHNKEKIKENILGGLVDSVLRVFAPLC